jgi:uncharacterized lipoprotein YmbA
MRARHVAVAGLAVALSSCVTLKRSPEARFFVLRSLEVPAQTGRVPSSGVVGLLSVRVPGYLERPQVVTWVSEDEIRIDEFLRWAEPLDVGVSRILAENLSALLPQHPVARAPWSSRVTLMCRVRVDLQRFGRQTDGEVQLVGRWAILPAEGDQPLTVHPVNLARKPRAGAGLSVDAEVGAMSELLADLARQIGDAIQTLPPPTES